MKNEKMNLNRAATVALMAVLTLAICFIILGSISVELMAALGIDSGRFGNLVFGFFLTSCIVQLFVGPLVDKIGYKPVAILGFIITSISLAILAFSTSFPMAFIACVLMGVGAMALNTVGNTLIPVVLFKGEDPARASNFGNAFFALGYVLTPLLIVLMLNTLNLNYNHALIIISILLIVFLIVTLTATFPKVSIGFKFSMAFKLLSKPPVIIAALALFCYLSLETSMATWIRMLMEELYSGAGTLNPAAAAGIVLSLFGASMMIGRFLTSTIKNVTAIGPKILIIMSVLALLAILLMMFAGSPAIGIVAVILAGLVFAPIFPTLVGVTFSKFDPSLYGSIFGIIFSFALLGGTFVPNFIGNLIVDSTVQGSLWIAGVIAAILLVLSFFIGRVGKQKTTT